MSKALNPFARRLTAGIGIAAVAAATMFGSMLPASAADTTPGPGNIDNAISKSLTIHKFAQPATMGTAPDGTELPGSATSGLDALNGVKFKVEKVNNIDLSTNEGWAQTVGLVPDAVAPANLTFVAEAATVNGVVTFPNLVKAVYLVTETDSGANNIAFAAKPFLVTLPLPSKSDSSWIYDVHVYPKNSITELSKAVDDSAATGLGTDVKWSIAAKVPAKSEGNALESFAISDALDSRLSYRSATVTLAPATSALVLTDDYTIDTTTTPGTVLINFTPAGLAKLVPGATVNVSLVTTVVSLGDVSGAIENKAGSFINDGKFTSNTVKTVWGNVIIHKVAANDESKSLTGAEFQVYTSEADAKAGNNPVAVSSTSTFTSNASGIVQIDGLRATLNGSDTAVDYWLVETKAPAGYTIASDASKTNPKQFKVAQGKVATTVDITVANPQTPPFMLPLTGGPGTVAFMIVGLGLLSIAGGVALRKRSTRRVSQI
ncbi:SpaH/EbpB family LPXTG-anchored major pilin [Arthrobacter psychrolactophilus]